MTLVWYTRVPRSILQHQSLYLEAEPRRGSCILAHHEEMDTIMDETDAMMHGKGIAVLFMDRTGTMIAIDTTIVGTEMTLAQGENEVTLQSQVRTLEERSALNQLQEVQIVLADQKGELVQGGIKMMC